MQGSSCGPQLWQQDIPADAVQLWPTAVSHLNLDIRKDCEQFFWAKWHIMQAKADCALFPWLVYCWCFIELRDLVVRFFNLKIPCCFFIFFFFTSLCMWEHRQWCWWWKPAGGNVLEVFSQLKYWKTHYLGKINLAFLLFFCEYLHGWRKGCLKTAWFLLTIRQWRGVTASIPLNKLILFLARSFLPVH